MITKKYYKLIRVSHEDSAYMRLKNVSNELGIFKMVKTGSPITPNLEYSLDGVTWITYDFTTLPEVGVAAGANIYFRGTNANQKFNRDYSSYVRFSFNKTCEGHGNMCSLFDPDPAVFSTITTIGQYGLYSCFSGCTSLTVAPDLSNVTYVGYQGLASCFKGCTSLVTAPDFGNITTVDSYGLSNAFENCIRLSTATAPNVQDLTVNSILNSWLNGAGSVATGTKTVRVPTGATIGTGNSGIPGGWTRVDY